MARRTGFINGPGGARCTQELKSKVRKKIQKGGYDFQVFGFEYKKKEINRAVRFKQQNPKVRAIFPLIDKKLTKENCAAILIKSGIELPAMYRLGYKNNNCVGCLVGGGGYWNKIRNDFPETFLKMAQIEREIEGSCLNGIYLDELDPNFGRKQKHVAPECDSFCEIEFADLIDPITEKILKGECSI